MEVFDIFSDGFNILKKQPDIALPMLVMYVAVFFCALLAVVGFGAVLLLIHAAMPLSFGAVLAELPAIAVAAIIFVLVIVAASAFIEAMYISMAAQGKRGRVSLSKAYDVAKKTFVRLFLLDITKVLILLAVLSALGAVFFFTVFQGMSSSAGFIAGLAFLFIIGIIAAAALYLSLFQSSVVLVMEGKGVWESIDRSIEICKARFFTLLLFVVIFAALAVVFSVIMDIIDLMPLIGFIIGIILNVFFGAWAVMLPTLFYLQYGTGGKAGRARRRRKM